MSIILPKVYFVVPCYNEEEVLPETSKQLLSKLQVLVQKREIDIDSKILFIDDGSKDNTWSIIEGLHEKNAQICGVKLSCNKGHQNALLAGLMQAKEFADCVISLDADLQDDIDAVDRFIEKFKEGCEVVYGVRENRDKDTFFKRCTALGFYKFMSALGVDVVYNHADYRLMSRRVLEALGEYREVNLFLRGIIPLIGFRHDYVYYTRHERFAGESKYPLRKMLAFALEGITSFSIKPLRIISTLGVLISLFSIFGLAYAIIPKLLGHAVQGWSATLASIWLIGGIQLLSIGVCGEYIGKIYSEVKNRPRYRIEKFLNK